MISRLLAAILISLIRAYQFVLRPLLSGGCRFIPTCSEYGVEAIRRHGPWHGVRLTFRRVLRCRPGVLGGYDPVP